MRTRRTRRTTGLLALAAAAALTAVGCTARPGLPAPDATTPPSAASAPAGDSAAAAPAPGSATPAGAGRRLSPARLLSAVVPEAYLRDSYGTNPAAVRKPRKADTGIEPPSDPACARLLDAANARQQPDRPPAVVEQTFNWKDDAYGSHSVLASYDDADARAAFAQVRDGLTTCRAYEQRSPGRLYQGTVDVAAAPVVGDEAVQFQITAPTEDGPHVTRYTMVRTGNCVATFVQSTGRNENRAFPPYVIALQVMLLQQAQGAA
ncbi:hypothetical protein [Streptomyces sp. NPDC058613]|uniref:hypothetical protein n=1 Tax=unclassified Streptomyces TaxID=2593676 RepID=UPI003663842A